MGTEPIFNRPSLILRRAIGSLSEDPILTIIKAKWIRRKAGPYAKVLKIRTVSGLEGWIDAKQ